MIRALFYRGRPHLHASLLARPFDERPRVTVAAIAERLRREVQQRREAWSTSAGSLSVAIVPDVDVRIANFTALQAEVYAASCATALPEQLGAMSV